MGKQCKQLDNHAKAIEKQCKSNATAMEKLEVYPLEVYPLETDTLNQGLMHVAIWFLTTITKNLMNSYGF